MLLAPVIIFLPSCEEHEHGDHGHAGEAAEMDMDAVNTEISAMEAAYAVADNSKDADGVVAYYADDAQSLTYNAPTEVGKEAIKAGIMENFKGDTLGHTISFETTGVWAGGNYATETGTSTMTVTIVLASPHGGVPTTR